MARDIRSEPGVATYEIRVRGELDESWADWFAGLIARTTGDGETVLVGTLDQAALHAVLRRIRDLGVPLISIGRAETKRTRSDSNGRTEDQS